MRSNSSWLLAFKVALHIFFLCCGIAFAYSTLTTPDP
ncbi:putative membrane protein [Burkholderia thailandensis MSMB121]|nr:putative membrane protein [Burkholderia thailandensis MSMB121]AJY38728.1 putative membrane protein [Burkholderia sp. 2002721687]